jgi:hypothetical protein
MKQSVLKRALLPVLLAIGISTPVAAFANTGDIALGVKGSTAGIGGEVTVGVIENLNFRTGYNAFNYDGNATKSDINYDYKLRLSSLPLLLDLHPFGGSFRVTSGIFINNNKVTATAKANSGTNVTINGQNYAIGTDIGSLTGKVDFRNTAPYLGIGWGNAVGKHSRVTISFDAGVMFQGTPNVSLTPNNVNTALVNTVVLNQNIASEEAQLKNDIKDFRYYPVVSLGLAYKF